MENLTASWRLSMVIIWLLIQFLADAGEKIGLQITILLADIIYVEILQTTVPVFDSYGNTPLILNFFIVSIILNCICLLISAHTLYLSYCPDYEVRNFSRTEARISIEIAKFFTKLACGMWNIDIPENTKTIADTGEQVVDMEDLHNGMKFYAEMINKLSFFIITITILITFFCTFVQLWIRYSL